jgi:hypothetical protein
MKNLSPLATLAAVAAAGTAVWLVNGSHDSGSVPATALPVAAPASVAAPAQAPAPRPQTARYHAEIPTGAGLLVVDITLEGDRARAYACDGEGVEVWLRGRRAEDAVDMTNTGGTGRLTGRITRAGVEGTLTLDGGQWSLRAEPVGPTDA